MTDNVRMLWCSNGRMKKTGYGTQSNVWLPRVKRAGYDVWAFNVTENMGSPTVDQDGIPTLYKKLHVYGNDVYAQHMEFSRAAFSLTLFNGWLLCEDHGKYPNVHWAPIDSNILRPDEDQNMRYSRWTWSMSRWGHEVLRDHGFDPVYVPHGIDSAIFKPIDRDEARANLQKSIDQHEPARGYPVDLNGKFIIAMVGANNITPGRKGWFEMLRAFKVFNQRHPDSVMYWVTMMDKPDGVNLVKEIRYTDLPEGSFAYVNQYFHAQGMISDEWMNDLYNAADVHALPSMCEGFGLPVMEAQMAGCPVVVSDGSALTEMCLSGHLVETQPFIARRGWHWHMPIHDSLVEALEKAYQDRDNVTVRETAREKALAYDADTVFRQYMQPALRRITEELGIEEGEAVTA